MSVVESKPITPAELLAMPDSKSFELVDGELVERNVSVLSSIVEGNLFGRMYPYCQANQLGTVLTSSNGIQCFPDEPRKVRRPDISFVKRERMTAEHMLEGFLTIAPDLAVEVISPNDLATELNEKLEDYMAARIPLVWIIDPEVRTVVIHRVDGTMAMLHAKDELSGEDIIPGFRCRVGELFPNLVAGNGT
jgi:Uma2 family endonuclease